MALPPFLRPDLHSNFSDVVKEKVVSRIVEFSENFFSQYRKDRFSQIEFLDSNSFLPKDLSIILNILTDEWTTYIPKNLYISQFNHIIFQIQPDDFTFYTARDQLFEKILLSSTPTSSELESGILISMLSASESGLRDFVTLNRGLSSF